MVIRISIQDPEHTDFCIAGTQLVYLLLQHPLSAVAISVKRVDHGKIWPIKSSADLLTRWICLVMCLQDKVKEIWTHFNDDFLMEDCSDEETPAGLIYGSCIWTNCDHSITTLVCLPSALLAVNCNYYSGYEYKSQMCNECMSREDTP